MKFDGHLWMDAYALSMITIHYLDRCSHVFFITPLHLVSDSQVENVVAFGREGLGFVSAYHRSTSPLLLLAAALFLKNDVNCYFNNNLSEG